MHPGRALALATALLLLAAPAALAQSKLTEADFSLTVPKDWQVRPFSGLKYKIAHAPPVGGFAVNLNVMDDQFPGTIERYVVANEKSLVKLPRYRKVTRESFRTDSGISGVRLVAENEQQGQQMRQVFYFLPGKKTTKYVVTGTALAADGAKHDAVFNAAVRSFTVR